MGRLTQTSTNYSFLNGRTFTVSYAYDAASNRTSLTDAESGVTTYAYDNLNRLTLLNNWLSQSFGFSYDVLGRRTALTRPNSVNSSYAYDDLSRLLSIVHARNGTTLDGASYAYGSAGQRTSRTNLRDNTTNNYTYDPVYELTQSSGATNEAFTFDPVGNMLTAPVGRTYGYNSSNQLTTMNGQTAFQYDQNGNRTWANTGMLPWTHTWDFEDRLTAAIIINGTNISFTYDPFGRRIKKTQGANTTIYVYDGANLIEEVNGNGNEVARYTHGPNIDEPLAQLRSGTTSYYEADGLGSITSLTNTGGTIANWYSYSSFGSYAGSSGSVVNPFRFTGREYDSETGLYYYRARYYDTGVDRFISEDQVRFRGGLNFYAYAKNSPLDRNDPLGLCPCRVTIRCWYIEFLHLGKLGYQHCYAEVVDTNGDRRELGGGPNPETGRLDVWGWRPNEITTRPSSNSVYWNRPNADCKSVNCMKQVAAQISSAHLTYNGLYQNSNSALATMLLRCGLGEVVGHMPTGAIAAHDLWPANVPINTGVVP